MAKLLTAVYAKVGPVLKAVVAAVVPLLVVGFTSSFNWKAILAAGLSAALVYVVPNVTAKAAAAPAKKA